MFKRLRLITTFFALCLNLFIVFGCASDGTIVHVESFTGKTKGTRTTPSRSSSIYVASNDNIHDQLFLDEIRLKIVKALIYNKYTITDDITQANYILLFNFDIKPSINIQRSGLRYEPGETWESTVKSPSGKKYEIEGSSSGKLVERQYTQTFIPKSFGLILLTSADKKPVWAGHSISINSDSIRYLIDHLIISAVMCLGQYCSYDYNNYNFWNTEDNKIHKMVKYMNSDDIENSISELL